MWHRMLHGCTHMATVGVKGLIWTTVYVNYSSNGVLQVNMTTNNDLQSVSEGSSEWELVRADSKRTSTKYECCPNPYVDIKFQLLLRRRPTFASHLFIAPSIILCLITPTIFILPPASFEKLTLGKSPLHRQ